MTTPAKFSLFQQARLSHALLAAVLTVLPARVSPAETITDNFTNPANWGTALSDGGDLTVANGRMNYTSATFDGGIAGVVRNAPLLPTTQDWSLKVDAHLSAFALTTPDQGCDVYLGIGKTGDWDNTHMTLEFGRGLWGPFNGYYIEDEVRIDGTSAPNLVSIPNLTSPDVALRMDYSAATHTITYYSDSDGASGGYTWVARGSANIAGGTYNLNLGPGDTLGVLLVGSSDFQTVAAGQAYLSNLEITVNAAPVFDSHSAVITNRYFPMNVGAYWVFEGMGGFSEFGRADVIREDTVDGVKCLVISINDVFEGEASQLFEWLAQDTTGAVWELQYQSDWDPYPVPSEQLWMPPDPMVGQVLNLWGERYEVTSVSATATVPAGVFPGCLELKLMGDPWGYTELYAPGVGQVHSYDVDGYLRLTSYGGLVPHTPSPIVTTSAASGITTTTATLNGTVNPNGLATTAQFEYGLTTAYGSTAGVTLSPNNGTTVQNVSASLSGLQVGQTYHYRLSATNSSGTSPGGDVTFVTPAPPAPEIAVEQPAGTSLADGSANVAFGSTEVGTSLVKTFTVKNLGTADLTGLAVSKDGTNAADFSVASPAGTTLAAGASTTFSVTFTPTAAGARTVAIHIASNDADENPFDVSLSGTGVVPAGPEIAVEQPVGTNLTDGGTLDFGTLPVGSGHQLTFTIRNAGAASLTGLAITKDGTNANDFAVSYFYPTSLSAGASATFTVNFIPAVTGSRSAAIHLASNDPDENPFDIILNGNGSAPGIFNYQVTDRASTAAIIGYTGPGGAVVIPDTINGLRVTGIGYSWWGGSTWWGGPIFDDYSGVTSVAIPASVNTIGIRVFSDPPTLEAINVDPANPTYRSVDGVLFSKSKTLLIQCPGGKGGTYTIPGSVASVGDSAFANCTGLTSVTIPNSVTSIADNAFSGCISLTGVTIPNTVTSIGSYAFHYCTSLTSVTIPSSVASLGNGTFGGCTSLTSVTIPSGVASLGNGTFGGCTSLTAIEVEVGNSAYASLDGVLFNSAQTVLIQYPGARTGSYSIPEGITSIPFGAFSECPGLTSVTIPASVTSIEYYNFNHSHSLAAITVAAENPAYSSLDGVLFDRTKSTLIRCPSAKSGSFAIPGGVISIGDDAFSGCTALTIATIPSSVTSIGAYAFSGCTGLTSVTIPSSVTRIGNYSFNYCTNLTAISVDMANPAYSSVDGVLFNHSQSTLILCPSAKAGSVTIPASVTSIADRTFSDCTSLTAIMVDASNAVYSSSDGILFNKNRTTIIRCPHGKSGNYTIPQGVTTIEDDAFNWCGSLTSVIIPASVTSIGDYAFSGCTGLTAIMVDASNAVYSSSDGVLFNKNQTTLILCPEGKVGGYFIASNVTRIVPYAFSGCARLTTITVETGNAFYSSLDGVLFNKTRTTLIQCPGGMSGSYSIPNSVTSIEIHAFHSCERLTSVTIPNSVTEIGYQSFYACTRLTSASFLGHAPAMEYWGVFDEASSGFTVYYLNGKTGFTSPTWRGYPAVNMGEPSPVGLWLLASGFPAETNLQSDPNGDGVNLLLAYALNLDPNLNLSGSVPRPVFAGNQLSMTFYAGSEGVTYTVETSTDLQTWTTTGVTVTALDANKFRTATVPMTGPRRFMRLGVSVADTSPVVSWLVANGFTANTNLQSDPNGDGVNLLLAYALNLDPKLNLSASMPRPVISGNQLSITFYAGTEGVTYAVETSTDLKVWSTTGVNLSAPDANKLRTASVPMTGPNRFLRLAVAVP